MQHLTFTLTLLRQRRFLSFLLPFFAVFLGLGAPNLANAQSTINFRNVRVTSGTTAAAATTSDYNANTGTPGPGVFEGTDFGSFDFGTGQLLLQGGSIEVVEDPNETYPTAFVDYGVRQGTLATTGAANVPALNGSIQLTQTNYNASTRTRTFALSNAAINILAMASTSGTYRFDVSVSTGPGQDGDGTRINPILGARRRSVFTATGTPVVAPTLTATTVFISPNGASNTTYDASNVSGNPDFNGANLGVGNPPSTFDVNNGQLLLNGGTATTRENSVNMISNVTLYYRVRGAGMGGNAFNSVSLTQETITTNADNSRTRTFSLSTAARNLLAGIGMTGTYSVDVYFQASGTNTGTNTNFLITDDNGGSNYVANFTVSGTVFQTTVWTGGLNDNWFDAANWDNGVPNASKNAIIPNFPSASGRPYPNIYSNAVKPATPQETRTNPDGTTDVVPASPGYDNSKSGDAEARNLTLQGNNQLDRSILRLIVGRLNVYGDFTNPQGSFIQRAASIISFKGGTQTISGSINGFFNVEIDGVPNSIKTLTNSFNVKSGGYLKFINGILQTNIALVSTNFVSFEGSTIDPSSGITVAAAQLLDESEVSFLRGFITTSQPASIGVAQNFSNIGITLTFSNNNPGVVNVTRNNGGNYPASAFSGTANNPNPNPKPSIRRVFGVQPGNPNTNNGGLSAQVDFRYLDNELTNLQASNGTTTNLDEAKLALYVSTSGGDTFSQLGRTSHNTTTNVLTKVPVTVFATYTLSEATTNPLPVSLSSFDAKRSGADALVIWQTASEQDNKGFNVQVSTDGTNYRTIGFVASSTPNSTAAKAYSFTDTEKNKIGNRYYRLEQVDLDGKSTFAAPRIVNFDGKAIEATSSIVAYPNPLNNEILHLSLNSSVSGTGVVRVLDMTGRQIALRNVAITIGSNDVAMENMSELKSGLYILNIMLPSGEKKTMKVTKQ